MPEPDASQTKTAADRTRELLADFLSTFSAPDGKRVLAYLHTAAATGSPAYRPGGDQPFATFFQDGRKSVVLEIEANLARARTEHGRADPPVIPKALGRARPGKQKP